MRAEFLGFPREDGAGTRDYLGVIASVICATTPVREIAARVPGAVAVTHQYGCAQVGDDIGQTRRTLAGVAANPNLAAALIVGLGCETNQAEELAELVPAKKPVAAIGIQRLGGSAATVEEGVRIAGALRGEAAGRPRRPLPLSALRLGVFVVDAPRGGAERACQCSGAVVDLLVDAGATVIAGLTAPLAPAGVRLAERARSGEVGQRLRALGEGLVRRRWAMEGEPYESAQAWNPEEQERAGALASALGTRPIQGLLAYGERPAGPGLYLMPLPTNPVEALAGLLAGGASIILVASARGVATGVVGCPTVVAAPRGAVRSALDEFVDHWIEGGDLDQEAQRLLDTVVEVASGRLCAAERSELSGFGISQVGTAF